MLVSWNGPKAEAKLPLFIPECLREKGI